MEVEIRGGGRGQPEMVVVSGSEPATFILRSSPMREEEEEEEDEPDSLLGVELSSPGYVYKRRGALRNRRAYSQDAAGITVPHLSPYFRPRNQSTAVTGGSSPSSTTAASSAAAVHRAAMLAVGGDTARVTLDEEEEEGEEVGEGERKRGGGREGEEEGGEEEEEEEEPNLLVESVKHKLLEGGHLSLLDVVEKMPISLHEAIVTDSVSTSCLDTITNRIPELESGHLAQGNSDSRRGAIHWFEGEKMIHTERY